ncbi:UPF0496 protein 1-like [Punica granatum]|uniref:UPF0496 protein 1-like n=1 Tax=Punica granatum TaxID=22663 RepID=A0A218XFU6_PUNGR|nr:UPF0496 protein 1-like [Punica granatum]OWM83794.1 hypothetical protein CDL15_Pgr004225 [Punica granatum]
MDEEVARVVMDSKEDIWKSKEMSEIVNGFFENSLRTLDFCTELMSSLKHAKDRQFMSPLAPERPEEDHQGISNRGEETEKSRNMYLKTLEELKTLNGTLCTEELLQILQTVYESHIKVLERLKNGKLKLHKKLRGVQSWRKVTRVIFVTTSAAVVICSVVAAAAGAASTVVASLSAATAFPISSVGKWIDGLLKKYEDALKGQIEVLSSMQVGTCVVLKDLKTIGLSIGKLDKELKSLTETTDPIVDSEVSVKKDIGEVKEQLWDFMECVDELGVWADRCSHQIRQARMVVLRRIINRRENLN